MDVTSSNPLLPLEIFSVIIEELVGNPDSLPSSPHTFYAVKQCAIVCKSFAALCQPYVFRIISNIRLRNGRDARTKNFIHIIQSNPNLSRYVRHISIESLRTMFTVSRDEDSQSVEVLKGFSNLTKLDIRNYSHLYRSEQEHPQHHYDDLRGLIHSYVAQGTLHSLTISGIGNLPVVDIFSCSTIREFGMGPSLIMPSVTISAHHITRFKAESPVGLDVGVLSFFPNLQELSVWARCILVSGGIERAPSFDLRVLIMSIEDPGAVATFLDFYNQHAEPKSVTPFGKLEKLRYDVPFQEDIEAVERMLQTTKLLKVLNINSLEGLLRKETYPLARLQLSSKILNVFPQITQLSFCLHVSDLDGYNDVMTEFADVFAAIEGKNVIEDVTISIDADASVFDLIPSCEPWSRTSRSVSSCTTYPNLRAVSAQLWIDIKESTDVQELQWLSSVDAENYMSHAMKEVVERKGVHFEGKMNLRQICEW